MSPELQATLSKFVFLAVELSMLFLGISLFVGVLQRHIPAEKIQAWLSGNHGRSYFLAAALGAVTPFCSCSTIPMLKGLIRARAGFGPMMVFLFTSPLLNPVVVVLLLATFGWKLTSVYVVAALLVSLTAGWAMQAAHFDRYMRTAATHAVSSCSASVAAPTAGSCNTDQKTGCSDGLQAAPVLISRDGSATAKAIRVASRSRYAGLWTDTWQDFTQLLPYLFLGVLTGSVIYGFMPIGVLEQYAGPDNPVAIPVAAMIGIPLYIRAEAVIPLAAGLMSKGAGAGTVLALIIGSAGASLTELILLRALFTTRLIATFVIVVLAMAVSAGYVTYLIY